MQLKSQGILTIILSLLFVIGFAQEEKNIPKADTLEISTGYSKIDARIIQTLPIRTSGELILTSPNSYYLKGGRFYSDGLETGGGSIFIDGMKVQDGNNFLLRSIENYTQYRSNQPIQLGDVAGSMSIINTRSFKDSLHIEADVLTAIEKNYQNTVFELLVGGPIRFRPKENRVWKRAPSFIVGGEFNNTNDADPSWEDKFITKQDSMDFLTQTPLRKRNNISGGTFLNSEFTLNDAYKEVEIHQNAARKTRKVFGKIEIPVSDNMELTTGGYFNYDSGSEFNFENALFNSSNNALTTIRNIDSYINWKHEILSRSDLKISYNMHFQYSNYFFARQNERHADRWFDYGYLGKYQTFKMPSYEIGDVEIDGVWYDNVALLNSWDNDTAYTFQNLGYNPESARFTEMIYELYPENENPNGSNGYWRNEDELTTTGGLLNGMSPGDVYGLWTSQGSNAAPWMDFGSYSSKLLFGESNQENYRGVFQFDVQYRKHNFKVGFEYSQKAESSYGINPNGLWTGMRGYTNFHVSELDLDNPILIFGDDGTFSDTVIFYRHYEEQSQFQFDKSLRQKLGLPVDGVDFILTDSYDMKNNTIDYYDKDGVMHSISTPENLLSLDMFDPMELIWNKIARYQGYTYDGNKMKSSGDPYSFYTDRTINAFKPVYSSIFIEDDFTFKSFTARVGVKLDYYDANQPMMKDIYTLYEAYTKGELDGSQGVPAIHPENIGDDYVVYVDDGQNPTHITGYRQGDTWYNNDGEEISDPEYLNAGSGVVPYLKYPDVVFGDENWQPEMTFTDYKPVWSFLPQVNLNYKLWRMNAYANFNSFSKNPFAMHIFRPEDYFMFVPTSFLENPGLKPYRVYKFNIGGNINVFKNLFFDLSFQHMSVTDYFIIERVEGAYPRSYISSANYNGRLMVNSLTPAFLIIPSTVSGWNANVSLTYSFLDEGTRDYLNISDFVINSNLGYDFGYGQNFTFPHSKTMKIIFEGFNASLFYQSRSGTFLPRTTHSPQNYDYSPDFSFFNLRLEKGFYIKPAKLYMSAYFVAENLFNQQNVYYVDPTTGAVNDDGYLSAPEWQQEIEEQNSPDSYRMLYQMKLNNPAYYAKPRIMRVGLIAKF